MYLKLMKVTGKYCRNDCDHIAAFHFHIASSFEISSSHRDRFKSTVKFLKTKSRQAHPFFRKYQIHSCKSDTRTCHFNFICCLRPTRSESPALLLDMPDSLPYTGTSMYDRYGT